MTTRAAIAVKRLRGRSRPGRRVSAARAARRASRGLWRDAFQRLLRNGPALVGVFFILIFVLGAIFAPVISPYDPTFGNLALSNHPPSLAHLMGTDLLGRDEFSRILYGARLSLQVGVIAVVFGLILGVFVGALAGGAGGRVDAVLMRVTDVFLAVPGILLAIGIVLWAITFAIQRSGTRRPDAEEPSSAA